MTRMIYNKLLGFQKQGITITKDATNPHFRSSYATLNEVMAKVKEPLNALGILIMQIPEGTGLRTILWDADDGSTVECFMPYVETTTPQKLVSNNTYNRRVSLVTLLGLEDEDDDGNVSSAAKVSPGKATKGKPVTDRDDEPFGGEIKEEDFQL